MNSSAVNDLFDKFQYIIKHDFSLDDDWFVAPLSENVVLSSKDNSYKEFLFLQTNWISLLETISSTSAFFANELNNVSELYLRLLRGVFLLARNILSVETSRDVVFQNSLYKLHIDIAVFYKNIGITSMKLFLTNAVLEFLCNLTTFLPDYQLGNTLNTHLGLDIDPSITEDTLNLIDLLCIFIENNSIIKSDRLSLLLYFNNLVTKNDNFIQYGLRSVKFKKNTIEDFFVSNELNESFYESLLKIQNQENNVEELLDAKDLISLKTFKKFLIHESVPSYLESLNVKNTDKDFIYNHSVLSNWLKISTILLCSVFKYDSLELTNIMIWVFMFLDDFCSEVTSLFDTNNIASLSVEFIDSELTPKLDFLYEDLVNILDLVSFLLQFEHCQKFLIHYKGVEKLSRLLQTLHTNCYKLSVYIDKKDGSLKLNDSLKKNENYKNWVKLIDSNNNKIKSLNFPHCKSLIVEILNKLLIIDMETKESLEKVHQLQEQMRELGVLEIILSNCGIDDNEPFIKERCIMFLKHLLYKNNANQNLVAKLEQRNEVDSESESLLEEVGYEVDIRENGSIGLKKSH